MSDFLDENGLRHFWSKILEKIPGAATIAPKRSTSSAPSVGTSNKYAREDHIHQKPEIYETELGWTGPNLVGDVSPIDAAMIQSIGSNKGELCNPKGVNVEYSNDGGETWSDYPMTDEEKVGLLSASIGATVYAGARKDNSDHATIDDKLRITINAHECGFYTSLKKFIINITTNGAINTTVEIERALGSDITAFTTIGVYKIFGWSGWNSIPIANFAFGGYWHQTSQVWAVRLTFSIGAISENNTNRLAVMNVLTIGTTNWITPSPIAKTGHLYTYTASGNAAFPATVTATSFYGNTQNTTVASMTSYSNREDLAVNDTLSVLFGKISAWFKSLKALAFKDKIAKTDLENDVANSLLPTISEADEGKLFGIANDGWAFVDPPIAISETVIRSIVNGTYSTTE